MSGLRHHWHNLWLLPSVYLCVDRYCWTVFRSRFDIARINKSCNVLTWRWRFLCKCAVCTGHTHTHTQKENHIILLNPLTRGRKNSLFLTVLYDVVLDLNHRSNWQKQPSPWSYYSELWTAQITEYNTIFERIRNQLNPEKVALLEHHYTDAK